MVEHNGAEVAFHLSLTRIEFTNKGITNPETLDQNEKTRIIEKSKEKFVAMAFLCQLHNKRYQSLMDTLSNDYLCGNDNYPTTLVEAHTLVANWKGKDTAPIQYNDNVNFTNVDVEDVSSGGGERNSSETSDCVNATNGTLLNNNGTHGVCFNLDCRGNYYCEHCPKLTTEARAKIKANIKNKVTSSSTNDNNNEKDAVKTTIEETIKNDDEQG